MKITIVGRKMNVKDSFKEHAEKKLARFNKFFNDDAEAKVMIFKEPNTECVELTINSEGTIFRSEQKDATFMNALDSAVDIIERQIRKNKTRLEKRLKSGAFDSLNTQEDTSAIVEEEDTEEFSVRYKTFSIKPMSVDEAILQMNLIGHDFFVFENDVTGEVNVVYRRKNNKYGCIVKE